MNSFDVAVFIGRFQPFHMAHLKTVQYALSFSNQVFLVLGGDKRSISSKNPWTTKQRMEYISAAFNQEQLARIQFIPVRDRIFHDTDWISNIVNEVENRLPQNAKVALVGYEKDGSSYYLNIFPRWTHIPTKEWKNINATDFRKDFFLETHTFFQLENMPPQTLDWLYQYKKTSAFVQMQEEFTCVPDRTSDVFSYVFVRNQNYLLLEKRPKKPGKDQWSLPGDMLQTLGQQREVLLWDFLSEYFLENKDFFEIYSQRNVSFQNDLDGRRSNVICLENRDASCVCPKIRPHQVCSWVLVDELPFCEDKLYADHYQMIRTLMLDSR